MANAESCWMAINPIERTLATVALPAEDVDGILDGVEIYKKI